MSRFEEGTIIRCTVTAIESYGAFVSCNDYYTGLIHISEISNGFVKDINDFIKVGEVISAEVLQVDEETGHLRLSIKNIPKYKRKKPKREKIKETSLGFKTLAHKLPFWINESLEKMKNK